MSNLSHFQFFFLIQIAVIAEGSIQELGTHNALLREDGIYATLCKAQGIRGTEESAQFQSSKQSESTKSVMEAPVSGEKTSIVIKPKGNIDDIEAGLVQEDPLQERDDDEEDEAVASMSRLWSYNRPEWPYVCMGLVGGVLVGALPPCEGILFGMLTSNLFSLEPTALREQNRELSLYFFLLAAVALLGNMLLGYGFSVAGFRLTRRMRVKVFEKILRHSIGWFDFPEHSTGELTTMLEEDAEAVSNVTGSQLGQKVQVFSSLATGLAISLSFSWQIGLTAIGW